MRKMIVVTAVLATGALVFLGCGESASEKAANEIAEKAVENALSQDGNQADVQISEDGESVTMNIQTADGGTMQMNTGGGASVPENFPADVPIYDGLSIIGSFSSNEGEEQMFNISATSSEAPDKVMAFYKEKLEAEGWKQQETFSQAGGMQMASFSKAERIVNITAMSEGDATNVTLTVAVE